MKEEQERPGRRSMASKYNSNGVPTGRRQKKDENETWREVEG